MVFREGSFKSFAAPPKATLILPHLHKKKKLEKVEQEIILAMQYTYDYRFSETELYSTWFLHVSKKR